MGLFSKFGGQKDYPSLGPGTEAAERLAKIQSSLETLVNEIPDKLEVVPAEDTAFVFIGKPPKKFGIAWIEDGEVMNLQALAQKTGVSPAVLQSISENLRKAYEKNLDAERYKTEICGKSVVVTPCEDLKREVENIIDKVVH